MISDKSVQQFWRIRCINQSHAIYLYKPRGITLKKTTACGKIQLNVLKEMHFGFDTYALTEVTGFLPVYVPVFITESCEGLHIVVVAPDYAFVNTLFCAGVKWGFLTVGAVKHLAV